MFYFHRNRNLKPSVEFVNEDPKSIANKIEERKQLNKLAKMKCKKCCTTSTPEWRSGPNGKKSLCNACGLKWSKSQKKESTDENSSINRGLKRRVHSFNFSTPTAKNSFLEDPSKPTTEDNYNKKLKEASSVDLQKIDDENHSGKTSESINKFSIAYILS